MSFAPLSGDSIAVVPLSSIRLSTAEESGDLARAVGFTPERSQHRCADPIPPWSVRFVHPPLGSSQQRPQYPSRSAHFGSQASAGHPWPRAPRQSA